MRTFTVICMLFAMGGALWAEEETAPAKPAEPQKIRLFNGENFEGWDFYLEEEGADPAATWQVRDGVIHCTGVPKGYMRTQKAYDNYRLTFQWRWPESAGNSGALLHISGEDKIWPKCIEAQLKSENAGDFWLMEGTSCAQRAAPDNNHIVKNQAHNEKPLTHWNTMKVECRGDRIRVWVNGLLQNKATQCTVSSGRLAFQSEGAPIEFRSMTLEPLPEQPEERESEDR